jgi:predicted membrane protein
MADLRDFQGRIFAGLLIIFLGIIFLLGSLGRLDVGDFFSDYWPLFLIFVGLWHIVGNQSGQNVFGFILILVGLFFLLVNLDILGKNVWKYFLPILLIAIGLWILFKPRFIGIKEKVPSIKEDDLNISLMFAGVNRRVVSDQFRGGKATALFGGIDLDMTEAKLAGNKATVELNAIFGGLEMRVPEEWKVVVDSNAILGGIDDKHRHRPGEGAVSTLYVKGTAIFGSIEIKN